MCLVLAYLGSPVLIDDLLFAAAASLVGQATGPRMSELLNLGGFGLAGCDQDSPDPAPPLTTARRASQPLTAPQVVGFQGARERSIGPRAWCGVQPERAGRRAAPPGRPLLTETRGARAWLR
jgi:hypothetical protein